MARYVVSDLHGRFDIYKAIESFRKSGDKIICLGDCGDRGPQSIETCKAVANNPDWTYMMGNHEHMTLEALKEEKFKRSSSFYTPDAFSVSINNGGQDTYQGMVENLDHWIKYLNSLSYKIDIKNEQGFDIVLTHAGFDPTYEPSNWDYIWDRSHIHMPWPVGPKYDKTILIHGHTPIPTINPKWEPIDGSFFYADGHKINIDCGSVWTGTAVMLNIDTFDEEIFELGGKNDS